MAYGAPDPALNIFNSTLLPEPTHRNPTSSYYLTAGQPLSEDLISPVNILSADLSKTASVVVDSANGSIAISPAGNPLTSSPARLGMNLESGPAGVIVSIGDPTIATTPTLQLKGQVAGVPTIGEVFDTVYNPPPTIPASITPGPAITHDFIVNSPAAGTMITTGASDSFTLTEVGYYILQLQIFIPGNQVVSFPTGACAQFRITDPIESQTYGGVSFTSAEIYSNFNSMFPTPASEVCAFSFNTLVYLGAGTYKIKTSTWNAGPFVFGPNMDSEDYPTNFEFTINYIKSLPGP
jgi:hypothetical protein